MVNINKLDILYWIQYIYIYINIYIYISLQSIEMVIQK